MSTKETGRVKWFDNKKGYGFAVNQAGNELLDQLNSPELTQNIEEDQSSREPDAATKSPTDEGP